MAFRGRNRHTGVSGQSKPDIGHITLCVTKLALAPHDVQRICNRMSITRAQCRTLYILNCLVSFSQLEIDIIQQSTHWRKRNNPMPTFKFKLGLNQNHITHSVCGGLTGLEATIAHLASAGGQLLKVQLVAARPNLQHSYS